MGLRIGETNNVGDIEHKRKDDDGDKSDDADK